MKTLDELKKQWSEDTTAEPQSLDLVTLKNTIRTRVRKNVNMAMKYFWASFVLQLIVYSLLSHVIAKYWYNTQTVIFSVIGILIYIPFTIMLMKKFKGIAKTRLTGNSETSIHQYVLEQQTLLESFYRFKKLYELMLIPLSSIIGVFLIFELYIPGGVALHPTGAVIVLAVTLLSCWAAIRRENVNNFEQPLRSLGELLAEFRRED